MILNKQWPVNLGVPRTGVRNKVAWLLTELELAITITVADGGTARNSLTHKAHYFGKDGMYHQ